MTGWTTLLSRRFSISAKFQLSTAGKSFCIAVYVILVVVSSIVINHQLPQQTNYYV